jgi:hypothetical protein
MNKEQQAMLILAAKAAGYSVQWIDKVDVGYTDDHIIPLAPERQHFSFTEYPYKTWNPYEDDAQCLQLARERTINIDYADKCAWKRLHSGEVIQEYFNQDCEGWWKTDREAVVAVAAAMGRLL